MSRVVIAGAGAIGQSLAAKLSVGHDVRAVCAHGELPAPTGRLSWHQADLTTIHQAELALAGAHTVVMMAQTRRPVARHFRAALADVDRLLADAVGRAARRVDVKHLVLFECGEDDVRAPLLALAGVPLSVLRGGAPDPVDLLFAAVEAGPQAVLAPTGPWTGPGSVPSGSPRYSTCSVQRMVRPAGWSALDVARAYFRWLPTDMPLVKTSEVVGVFNVFLAGVRVLALRLVPARSHHDCAYLEIADGGVVKAATEARFEFRIMLDSVTVLAALMGFESALPWPVYRATQAVLHERAMSHFAVWLAAQNGSPPPAKVV